MKLSDWSACMLDYYETRTIALTIALNAHFVRRENRYWSVNEPRQMFLYFSLAARYISKWMKKSLSPSVNTHEMHTSTEQQHKGEQNRKSLSTIVTTATAIYFIIPIWNAHKRNYVMAFRHFQVKNALHICSKSERAKEQHRKEEKQWNGK